MTTTETREPRVWIGCLAAYNAGTLHGKWFDVPDTVDELGGFVKEVISSSPEPFAEEWFFADNEGFHPWNPGEYPSWEKLVAAAALIREHGEAAAAWIANDESVLDDTDDLEERFREAYAGEWDSEEAFARNLVEELGLPGVGFLHVEGRGGFDRYVERSQWDDVLGQIDGMLDWGAVWRHFEGDYWESGGHYFNSGR